jgi:hypothetical protein
VRRFFFTTAPNCSPVSAQPQRSCPTAAMLPNKSEPPLIFVIPFEFQCVMILLHSSQKQSERPEFSPPPHDRHRNALVGWSLKPSNTKKEVVA